MTPNYPIEPAYLRGSFLNHYFLFDVLFSPFCCSKDTKKVYEEYARVFGIQNQDWLDTIREILSSDLFVQANTQADYHRLCRLAALYPERISSDQRFVLAQKNRAILIKHELLSSQEDAPFETVLHTVERRAEGGDTECLALLSFLEYHQLFPDMRSDGAEHHMRTAASWNHLFAILMGLSYTEEPTFYYKKLCALFGGPNSQGVIAYLKKPLQLGKEPEPDSIAMALDVAFCLDNLSFDQIHPEVMKLLHSTVLPDQTKAKLIQSIRHKEAVSFEVPLYVTEATEMTPLLSLFTPEGTARDKEFRQIHLNLSMVDLRSTPAYRPLLIISEDAMALDFYRNRLQSCLASSPMVRLSSPEGDQWELSPSPDHIFAAALDKTHDRNTVLVLEHCEQLKPETARRLAKLLHAPCRAHTPIGTHRAEVDFSGILPLLFASTLPDPGLVCRCDVLSVAPLSREEFREVLEELLAQKKKELNLDSLSMEPNVPDFLFDFSAETVMSLLQKAVIHERNVHRKILLTVPLLQSMIELYDFTRQKTGFWRT